MTNHSYHAKSCLHELVKHVFNHYLETLEGVTYQELARRIGRLNKHGEGHGRGMRRVLGDMGHLLQNLEGEWGEPIPHIQSLVVNKTGRLKGLPGDGIKEFWQDYPNLTLQEKINKVRAEYIHIMEFGSRWEKVLSGLDLPMIQPVQEKERPLGNKYGRGGESPQHLVLKKYVSTNPELIGANAADEAIVEYSLPSFDLVDVLFKSSEQWFAVEVKSRISDRFEQDYERGLYQCVKYRAILEAMKKDRKYDVPEEIHVVLLLETSLPKKYKQTAKKLSIKVIEDIQVPGEQT